MAAALSLSGTGCPPPPDPAEPTVFFASGADLQSINPLVAVHPLAKQVQKHILFLTLAAYDADLEPIPRLAAWSWDAGRTALTFRLRDDVEWHDGVSTTAHDVVWTLEMARDPRTAYPRARDLAAIVGVRAVDALTVEVRFARRQPRFPDVLTDLAILPRHHFTGAGGEIGIRTHPFNRQPVGNGPFRFVEYRPNQRWVFQRFAGFPVELGPADFERLVVAVVDEATTKLAALASGELDFAGINPAHAAFVRRNPDLDVIDYPVLFAVAVMWNVRRPPFDEIAMRRALTYALDRRVIQEAFLYGFGTVADGPVSPDHPWFEAPPPMPYDSARAGALLDSLGWNIGGDGMRERDGVPLAFDLLVVSGDNALEQLVQAQWRRLGIVARIRQLELASFLAVAQGDARDFDALIIGIPGDLSLGHVASIYDGALTGPQSYPGYRNPAFDRAMAQVRAAQTAAQVESTWRAAQQILARDHPTTWLYHARGVQGVNRRVRNVRMDLRGELATVSVWQVQP